jgi:hypothetical protein
MTDEISNAGYGRPPVAGRFKAGQSGNPGGRPKGSKNLRTLIKEEGGKKVVVQEGGRRKKVSKMGLAVTQLMNKAAQGEVRFVGLALDQMHNAEAATAGDNHAGEFAEADRQVIEHFLQRVRQISQGG